MACWMLSQPPGRDHADAVSGFGSPRAAVQVVVPSSASRGLPVISRVSRRQWPLVDRDVVAATLEYAFASASLPVRRNVTCLERSSARSPQPTASPAR